MSGKDTVREGVGSIIKALGELIADHCKKLEPLDGPRSDG